MLFLLQGLREREWGWTWMRVHKLPCLALLSTLHWAFLISSLQVTCNLFQLSLPTLLVPAGQSALSIEAMMWGPSQTISAAQKLYLIVCLLDGCPQCLGSLERWWHFYLLLGGHSLDRRKKKQNQEECNQCKVGVHVGIGALNNRQHLVDPFQNRTTVYGMKNCSHSGK